MPDQVSVEVDTWPLVSYAMAYNDVPFIDGVRVTGIPTHLTSVRVTVDLSERGRTLTSQWSHELEHDGSSQLEFRPMITMDPTAMSSIEEDRPGRVTVRVSSGDELLGETSEEVHVRASRHWQFFAAKPELSQELIGSFVMPNDPAITRLLGEARTLLGERTSSTSTEGYQSGSERVDQIVEAIWDAARALNIAYSNPPGSWAGEGQKVRTPSDVLEGRVGTCLDTSVVLAAALEHVGINSTIWLLQGHAFLGYWRHAPDGLTPLSLGQPATIDAADAKNAVDIGVLRILETTKLTGGAESKSFSDDAHRSSALNFLGGDLDRVEGVVDVYACRKSRILPMPAISRRVDGVLEVVEYRPAEHSGEHFVTASHLKVDEVVTDAAGRQIPPRIQRWKNSLLDLSLRNKLINFTPTGSIELAVPDGAISHVEDLLNSGKALDLLPSDQVDQVQRERGVRFGANLPQDQLHGILDRGQLFSNISAETYLSKFRSLAYKAKTIVEETGANNLYLALGSLNWTVNAKQAGKERTVKSPMILLPIHLEAGKKKGLYRIVLDDSGTSTPNFCLIEKLRLEDGLRIPALENPVEDDHGIDLAGTFDAVRKAIFERGLGYHVDESADIAILQFAKFRLWKDLDDSWEILAQSPLVRHMVESPYTDYIDPAEGVALEDLDALDAACPIPADASQLEAVAAAVAGKTFVLEGPPGTGKSQTITNLLTRAVVGGKRVLFVAEKRAALDVVSTRLSSVGLGPFCLDLHDKSSKPAAVRAQILRALDLATPVDEQGFAAQGEDLDTAQRTLDRYAKRLHEKNQAGLSFYSARTQALTLGPETEPLPVPAEALSRLTAEDTSAIRNQLRLLPDAADPARPRRHHPWGFLRGDAPGTNMDELKAAVRGADGAARRLSETSGAMAAVLKAAAGVGDLRQLLSVLHGPAVSLWDLDEVRTRSWADTRAQYEGALTSFTSAAHPGIDRVDPMALNLPLEQIRVAVAAAVTSGFFGRRKRLATALEALAPLMTAAPKRKEALPLIDELLETKLRVEQVSPVGSGVRGLRAPAYWNPWDPDCREALTSQFDWLQSFARAVDPSQVSENPFTAALRDFVGADVVVEPSVLEAIGALVSGLDAVRSVAPDSDVVTWLGDAPLLATWAGTIEGRDTDLPNSPALARWAALLDALTPLHRAGLIEACGLLLDGVVEASQATRALDLGIAQASIIERRTTTGLDTFDALAHNKAVNRFTASSAQVREHLTSVIPMQIVNARPFSSGADRGQVGALRRELQRQRGGLKVRALLDQYGDLITQLMPCVLVSPDSVARFFAVGAHTFDLVVFDEASQIRVADAIGAIGRARAVVVVGDSKQMPPTSFAESVSDTDDGEVLEGFVDAEDEESILSEAGQSGLRSRKLTWHYRSRDETLIAFSNEHYYDNTLSSFPAPPQPFDEHGKPTAGLSLNIVEGKFLRSASGKQLRTNPVEAQEIVTEIRRRFAMSPNMLPSIGVVTFNSQQRTMIEAMLRDGDDERIIEALEGTNGEGLFVKNLENVQGDERDLILFSVAFSKNDKGVLPLNFGPLGLQGGERRLNVAVTRARQQVIIYASFDPSELRAEDTKWPGIKHLRAYMELAKRGPQSLTKRSSRHVIDRHRDDLADALETRGLSVEIDLGLSDFKIDLTLADPSKPDEPSVAVLLDGEGWASRRTVGDRDGLPVAVLGGLMGWRGVERVWLPEWMADPEVVLDRLAAAVRSANALPSVSEPVAVPAPTSTPTSGDPFGSDLGLGGDFFDEGDFAAPLSTMPMAAASVSVTQTLAGATPYVRWTPRNAGDVGWLDNLSDSKARQQVQSVIAEILDVESPVQLLRLGKLTANAFGLSRVTPARVEAIVALVPGSVKDGFGFAWRDPGHAATFEGFRPGTTGEPRPLEEVHPVEIANAMVAITRAAWGIGENDLYADTLLQFGWKRRTSSLVAQLRSTLEMALSDGMLVEGSDGFIRAG